MTGEAEPSYEFEESNRRKTEEARRLLGVLEHRLGLPANVIAQDEERLVEYITACHLNISWYDRHIKREKWIQRGFVALSIVLLLGLPVVVIWWSTSGEGATSDDKTTTIGSSIVPAVTMLLTGLFAIHRSFSAWFSQRRVIGQFWKASSDLKSQLYEFEDRWAGREQGDKVDGAGGEGRLALTATFRHELREATRQAKETVRQETQQFYEQYSMPGMDLTQELRRTQAQEMTELMFSSRKRGEAQRERVRAVHEQRAVISGLERRRQDVLDQLGALADGDPARESLETERATYEQRLTDARVELNAREARREHPPTTVER